MNIDEGLIDCGENLASFGSRKTSRESPLFGESTETLETRREELDFDRGGGGGRNLGHGHLI
jgi:hypothetical protein